MKIIICGCGRIGKSILRDLVREGHEITLIDTDPAVIAGITEAYDVMGICASGTDCEALGKAAAPSAGLFIAATGSDETNLLSCFAAKRMGAEHTAARVGNRGNGTADPDFYKRELGISMTFDPDRLTAQTIYSILKFPSAVKSESFAGGRFEMAELTVKGDSILNGAVLSCLRGRLNVPFLVCCVLRGGKPCIPNGSFTLRESDRIGLLAAPDDMHRLLRYIGLLQKRARDITILGGSRSAAYLAKELAGIGSAVKIIESSRSRCDELCSLLPPSVRIICGDGTRHALLDEEGLDKTDAFVTLTGSDEENILSSCYALDRKVPRVITKVSQGGFGELGEKLGLGCILSPRRLCADVLTRYARALNDSMGSRIETLYSLMHGSAEALEFTAAPDFERLNVPLRELKLKPDILLAGILRGNKTVIPAGDDVIAANDRVIVIAARHRLCDLSDILL